MVALYYVAPGKHSEFLKWAASQHAVDKEVGIPASQWYAHTDGDEWDYLQIRPVTTRDQDKKSDESTKKRGMNTGLAAGVVLRQFDLLVSQAERVQDGWNQNPLPNDRASREQALHAIDQQQNAEVEAFLGPEKSRSYHEYQRTPIARAHVNQLGGELGSVGLPLDAGQRETLIAMLTEESERTPPPEPASGEETLDDFKRTLDYLDGYDRRIRERAADSLASQQLKYLADEQKLQEDLGRRALEMHEQAGHSGINMGNAFWYPSD